MNSKKSDRPDAGGGVREAAELLPENADERRMFDEACTRLGLHPLELIASGLHAERHLTSVPGASFYEQRTIAYNELHKAVAALSTPPAAAESNASVEAIITEIDTYSHVHGVLEDSDRERMAKLKDRVAALARRGNASVEARLREALEKITGAMRFVLAFYEPGQRYLDTNAWTQAEAAARAAVKKAEDALSNPLSPAESNGIIKAEEYSGFWRRISKEEAERLHAEGKKVDWAEGVGCIVYDEQAAIEGKQALALSPSSVGDEAKKSEGGVESGVAPLETHTALVGETETGRMTTEQPDKMLRSEPRLVPPSRTVGVAPVPSDPQARVSTLHKNDEAMAAQIKTLVGQKTEWMDRAIRVEQELDEAYERAASTTYAAVIKHASARGHWPQAHAVAQAAAADVRRLADRTGDF